MFNPLSDSTPLPDVPVITQATGLTDKLAIARYSALHASDAKAGQVTMQAYFIRQFDRFNGDPTQY